MGVLITRFGVDCSHSRRFLVRFFFLTVLTITNGRAMETGSLLVVIPSLLAVTKDLKSNLRREGFVWGQFHSPLQQGRQGARNTWCWTHCMPSQEPVNTPA